jgi:type IV secretory pathway VirB10-like protein
MGDLDTYVALMQALIVQRSTAASEQDKAAKEVARLTDEIRAVAKQIADTGAKAAMENTAPEAASPTRSEARHSVSPVLPTAEEANGAGHTPPGHPEPVVTSPPSLPPTPQARTANDKRLAPKKLRLLKLLRNKPEGTVEYFATKLYGDDNRHARVNVSVYFSDLKKEGYVGGAPGSFNLLEKGMLAIAAQEPAALPDPGAAMGK